MAWIRDGAPPEQIKVSFLVSTKEHPELAQFILSLPYRGTSRILREILSSAVKSADKAPGVKASTAIPAVPAQSVDQEPPAERPARLAAGGPPGVDEVSSAAAGIIENFDKMFPS